MDNIQNAIEEPLSSDSAIHVIHVDEEGHSFNLNEDSLRSILLREDVCDKKVSIVSVAGAFRKGKSFLLNFILRYLQRISSTTSNTSNAWIGSDSDPLNGFSWRGGTERDTSGILIWKDPFFVTLPSGEEVVVLLMDTQGAFDSQSTVKDCATIFALSTMISSLQIYNLSQNIQEDDLQHLQLFTEYGRLALEDTKAKPFQSLLFLVRDWSCPYEYEYGFAGGERLLERRLQVSDKQHPELQQLRHHIRSCFDDIQCFLMPHPGLFVATRREFQGRLKDIEPEFKQQLCSLIPQLLSPQHIVLKEINGSKVTCRELLEYFKSYITIFQGEELPEPKSMLMATAEANNLAAVAFSKAMYCRSMEEECGGDTPFMNQNALEALHERCRDDALSAFKEKRKMGGDDYSRQFLERLDAELMESFDNFVKVNNAKNLFRSAKTPACLFVVLLVDYLVKEIFEFLYMDFVARIFSGLLGVILLTICAWAYVRYSGHMRELGLAIDDLANFLWDNVLSPLSDFAVREGVKQATNVQRSLSRTDIPGSAVRRNASQRSVAPAARQSVAKKQN